MTYYKATRTDGTSFYDSTTKWKVGRITRHPNPDTSKGLCSDGVLHISDAPGETLVGGSWPCRLFEVEPRSALISGDEHKHGCTAVKVVRELPAWQALGPNGEAVAAHIEQCKVITSEQRRQLNAVGSKARDTEAVWTAAQAAVFKFKGDRGGAWYAAWKAAAAWDAARAAARDAARDAAGAAARDAWAAAWAAQSDIIRRYFPECPEIKPELLRKTV